MRTTSGNEVRGESGAPGVVRGPAAGTRPARPAERRESLRPGGRRASSPLPAPRPRVAAGTGRGSGVAAPGALPVAVVRRRRVVALLLAVAAVLAVGLAIGVVFSSSAEAADAGITSVTVVRPGESLQDVARRTAPGADERDLADRIRELNQLSGSGVAAGRPLVVPVG